MKYVSTKIKNVCVAQYADDFIFYIGHNDLKDCETELQKALNSVVKMLDNIGLQLSGSKSKVFIFSRGRRREKVELKINNDFLPLNDNIKYLGLWLDRSLRWSRHINQIVEKSTTFLNLLKVLAGSGWGIHPRHIRSLYLSLIRSRFDYGCYFYDNSAKNIFIKLSRFKTKPFE